MSSGLIALIPARGGSKRLRGKNKLLLNGHPLYAWAIAAAQEAGGFDAIFVSSDDDETLFGAERYGAYPIPCPLSVAHRDYTPDILWVRHAEEAIIRDWPQLNDWRRFAILRPTSPFRRGAWIRQAAMCLTEGVDSVRAMRPVTEHPGKMWRLCRFGRSLPGAAVPLLPWEREHAPWHSMPSQELPPVLIQTAALEIAWRHVLPMSISGTIVWPLICEVGAPEALDINTEADWLRALALADEHPEYLPEMAGLPALSAR